MLPFATDLPWPVQLGVAGPFVVALYFVGRWLLALLEAERADKKALYERVINEVVPALTKSTEAQVETAKVIRDVMQWDWRRNPRRSDD